jgi:hypothetical protein
MWVIVAVSLGLGDTPVLRIVPGPEYQTEAACVQATRGVRGRFDSERGSGGLEFSFCVPKGTLEIGPASPSTEDHPD